MKVSAFCLSVLGFALSAAAAVDPVSFVAAEVARGATDIKVPKGVYDVEPGRVASVFLSGVTNVTVDFQGGELRGRRRSGMLKLQNCRNVTVKNLTIDYPHNLPFTQGRIETVGPDGEWDVAIIAGYPDPENGAWSWPVQAYDGQTGDLVNPMRYRGNIKVVRTGKGHYRVTGGGNRKGKVGNIAVWSFDCETQGGTQNLETRAHAVYLVGCANCRMENVTVYSTPGSNGFREMFGEGGNTYFRCALVPRPPETDPVARGFRRLRSGNHDAFNSRGARKGPSIIRCVASHHCDDDVNIHGAYQYVSSVTGCTARVFVKDMYRGSLCVGDPVQFVTADGFSPADLLTIRSVRDVPYTPAEHAEMAAGLCAQMKGACNTMQEIAFDRPHAALKPGSLFISQNLAGNGFLLKDCRFGPNRARGFICNASYGTVENCTFDRTESYGVLSRPSYQWLEGGAARSVRFRNCTFIDCGVFMGTHPEMETTPDCHRDIVFTGCTFRGTRARLDLRCCRGGTLVDDAFTLPERDAVKLVKTADVMMTRVSYGVRE